MRGNCLDKSMIYKAEVTVSGQNKHCFGQPFRTFKERFYGHQSVADEGQGGGARYQVEQIVIFEAILSGMKELSIVPGREDSNRQGHYWTDVEQEERAREPLHSQGSMQQAGTQPTPKLETSLVMMKITHMPSLSPILLWSNLRNIMFTKLTLR